MAHQRRGLSLGRLTQTIPLCCLPVGGASTASTAADYEYKPLDPAKRQIRLLHPAIGRRDSWCPGGSLRFHVETVQLQECETRPRYYAISYAWGENVWSGRINLDGSPLTIPRGAEEALRGVLREMRSSKNVMLPLWIDAVCIDQHSNDDKAQQVKMMGDIFSHAECVFVWLGHDDGTSKRAMKACHELHDECLQWTNEGRDLAAHKSLSPRSRQTLPYMKLPPPPGCRLEDFYALLHCRWFRRLWVIQEIVLAKNAVLLRGKHRITWEVFALAVRWARHRRVLWMWDNVDEGDFALLAQTNQIIRMKEDPEEMTLESLLLLGLNFESSVPADKIYGLLGMVAAHGDPKTKASIKSIVPDYRKPLREIYAQAALLAMEDEKSLNLLRYASFSSTDEWPSWLPRFDICMEQREERTPMIASYCPETNAHNDFEAIVCPHPTIPFVLQVRGVSLGTIERIRRASADVLEGNYMDPETHVAVRRYFSYLWEPDFVEKKGKIWSRELVERLASALVCGHYSRDNSAFLPDAERDSKTIADFAAFMLEMEDHAPNKELQELLEMLRDEEADGTRFASQVKSFAEKFVNLELSHARFGMGLMSCLEGDQVCILFGSKSPFILRKEGEQYRLCGTVYVAGVMKGEYVQELEDTDQLETESTIFDIR